MKKILKVLSILLVCVVVMILGLALYISTLFQPVSATKVERRTFVISKGQSIAAIGKRLQSEGLIRNALVFRFVVRQNNLSSKVQAGSFLLSPSLTTSEIAQDITTASGDTWLTVLEGWRVNEIADMLDEQKLDNFDKDAFLALAKNKEGYLFPDSYLIQKDVTAKTLYTVLTDTFNRKVVQGLKTEIAQSKHPFKESLIMASLVQREAKDPQQMKMIAGILWNRVHAGTTVNVDSTLQYAKGYSSILKTWWQEPTASDKEIASPFNTYKNAGLPPAPIDNPGLDAIHAALDPTPSSYFYYLHDRQGQIHYATTLNEHTKNVTLYLRN